MRIRLLKDVRMKGVPTVQILAGSEIEAVPDVAEEWIKQGYAMPVRELPAETAELPAAENAMIKPPVRKTAAKKAR